MNCSKTEQLLPLLIYQDLDAQSRQQVNDHLKCCAKCSAQLAALEQAKSILATNQSADLKVSTESILRTAHGNMLRKIRRWRRATAALTATAAAAIICAVALNCELRFDQNQVVLRWGGEQAIGNRQQANGNRQQEDEKRDLLRDGRDAEFENIHDQLRLLTEIAQSLVNEGSKRHLQHERNIARLQQQLESVARQSAVWRRETEDEVGALYQLAQRK